MAVFKVTMLFQSTSGISSPNLPLHRTGGWSESWYTTGNDAPTVISYALQGQNAPQIGLVPARAALLPLGTSIVGLRVQSVSPPGPAQVIGIAFPGTAGVQADIPQMALLGKAPGQGVTNIRRFTLRGIPDIDVVEGEYQPQGPFGQAVNTFIVQLGTYQFRGRDLSQPVYKIVNISVTGTVATVQFETPVTFAVNDMVRVLRTIDANKLARGGRFQVASLPGANQITLNNWPYGNTTLGSVRKDAVVYPLVSGPTTVISRVVTRRVGRPFVGYRGRRSKRRS